MSPNKRIDRFHEFVSVAKDAGATSARPLPAKKIVLDERVRLKCEIPRCAGFGRFLTCPPYLMPVKDFARILERYRWSLLVQVEVEGTDSQDKGRGRINRAVLKEVGARHRPFKFRLLEVVETVERAAFKKGMRFATGLVGGSCVLCPRCVENKSSDPCRHPFRSRPAMEGMGIDVIQTAQNAGLSIHLSSSRNVLWTGLILLE